MMAADTLATDTWGLKMETDQKITKSEDGSFLIGVAGDFGPAMKWVTKAKRMSIEELLIDGYDYDKDADFSLLMAVKFPRDFEKFKAGQVESFRVSQGMFLLNSRKFHAIGSGRDYAICAMHFGRSAVMAVETASIFDNNTSDNVYSFWLGESNGPKENP